MAETTKGNKPVFEEIRVEYENTIADLESKLSQALQLNQKLITELESTERELAVFSEIQTGYEEVITSHQTKIEELQHEIEQYEFEKVQSRIDDLANRWMKKYTLPAEKYGEIVDMFSRFKTEEDFNSIERVLDIPKTFKEQKSPRPLTQVSTSLKEQTPTEVALDNMSPEQRKEALYQKYIASANNK